MSTDGVKIIDGDTAHDTYWGIMDLYDSGADFNTINNEYPIIQTDYLDAFDNEIYVTACALALWEIGQMTHERLEYVKSVIDKGASIAEWSLENKKLGINRKKELDKFWRKINQVNNKIRPRKKYRKISNLYFNPDDVLIFMLNDGNYKAVICTSIDQYRGQCNYILVPTTYNSPIKPSISDLYDKDILGRQFGSGYDQNSTRQQQPGIERIWEISGGNCNFFFGVIKIAVDHKDFIQFKDRFEKVGTLSIIEGLKQTGSFSYAGDYSRFEEIFGDLEKQMKIFQWKKYPVKVLCDLNPDLK
jgi:hypothetical protein